jgi:hypothetical protein
MFITRYKERWLKVGQFNKERTVNYSCTLIKNDFNLEDNIYDKESRKDVKAQRASMRLTS